MTQVIPVLNKTYDDSFLGTVAMTKTTADIYDSKEFTIQADKAITLTVQLPFTPLARSSTDWCGLYVGTSIKVDDTWYDLGHSGYVTGMALRKMRPARYFNSKYIDLVGEGKVTAGNEYKIIVKLRGRMYGTSSISSGSINSPFSFINQGGASGGNRGIQIDEGVNQNYVSIIIQEKDRP